MILVRRRTIEWTWWTWWVWWIYIYIYDVVGGCPSTNHRDGQIPYVRCVYVGQVSPPGVS